MVTLRERTTQYGIIINLPHDHTAASVNVAVLQAFADLPVHMKRTSPGTRASRWPNIRNSVLQAASRSTSPNAAAPGSAAPTRTSTAWPASTSEGTDLSVHSDAHVTHVTFELNHRAQGLGCDTPAMRLRFAAESTRTPALRYPA